MSPWLKGNDRRRWIHPPRTPSLAPAVTAVVTETETERRTVRFEFELLIFQTMNEWTTNNDNDAAFHSNSCVCKFYNNQH